MDSQKLETIERVDSARKESGMMTMKRGTEIRRMKQQETAAQGLGQSRAFLRKAYRGALLPCMLSILSGCVNIIADGVIVGQLIGSAGLTAINLCVPVYLVLCILGSFFVSGTAISASNEIGQDNSEKAQQYYGVALLMCLVSSLAMAAVGVFFSDGIAQALCQDQEVSRMVRDYTSVTLIGALPKIMIYIPFWFLRLDGKNKTVTVMMAVMGIGNILLDLLFLYVMDMGVYGAALASVIATALACVLGFIRLHTGKTSFQLRFAMPDRETFPHIAAMGSPAALNNLMQTVRLLCVNGILMANGGMECVAVFTVVNGIAAFSEAVTVGVPQAASAILGVYYGEHDGNSARIMLKLEWMNGLIYCGIFAVAISAFAGLIGSAYGLNAPLFVPMLCLALSLFPGLLNSILSSYYNVSGHPALSNLLIFCRVFLFSVLSLLALDAAGGPVWLFLPAGELLTVGMCYIVTGFISRRHEDFSRFLLIDSSIEKRGSLINFSVVSDNAAICDACEKVTKFCGDNGMPPKQKVRISLSLEELMTLVTLKNAPKPVHFDIRLFSLQGAIGIRIRYDGIDLDPLSGNEMNDEYMGVVMIKKMVEVVIYKRVFGLNSLLILI